MSDKNFFQENREMIVFGVLAALVLAIYWQTTGFKFINLDDNQYVYDNPAVLAGLTKDGFRWAWTAVHSANWHPLTWLSHMADVSVFGVSPGGHHAVNIVLHLVNSILAFTVFRRLTGCYIKSAIVAALFAVHPAHVESVAWVAERKDVLSTLFWLLTMYAYAVYVESPGQILAKRSDGDTASPYFFFFSPSYILVIVLLALGLTAKPMLVTLPFVLLLVDFWPLGRLKTLADLPKLLLEKLPLFALSAASCYITILAQRAFGAVETLSFLPLSTRLLNSVVSYAKYIGELFYPAKLAVVYPYEKNLPMWQIVISAIVLVAVSALCLTQFKTRKYLLFGWLWFLGTMVPVIGIVQVGSQSMADRYTYVPYFGLFVMIVWGVGDLLGKSTTAKRVFIPLFAIATLIFTFIAHKQTAHWRDNESLYSHALDVTGPNYLVSLNYCMSLIHYERLDEATPICENGVLMHPEYYEPHNAYGVLLLKQKKYGDAARSFEAALKIRPNYVTSLSNLSVAQLFLGQTSDAEANLEKAVYYAGDSIEPSNWINPLNNLANVWAEQGNHEKAVENLSRLLYIDPNNASARTRLAASLYQLKRLDEAEKSIKTAIEIDPSQAAAFNVYGEIMTAKGNKTDAVRQFRKALELDPNFTAAKDNLKKTEGEK